MGDERQRAPPISLKEVVVTNTRPQSEQELADYYYAHRDELDDLEVVPPPHRGPGRPSRGLSATITVRLTPEVAEIVYRHADEANTTLSEIVREAVRSLDAHRVATNSSPAAATKPEDR
jgi:hypothetical protein